MDMLYPNPLRPGDTICFVTPSLPIKPNPKETIDRREACIDFARDLGFKPHFTKNFNAHTEVTSLASRQMRLDDFNEALHYPFVSIVGGGGGAVSLLDGIDYATARKNRPVIMGMSDQTNIVNAVAAKAGLVTFYGPNGGYGHWYSAPGNAKRERLVEHTLTEIRSALFDRTAHLAPTGDEEDAGWQPVSLTPETFNCPDTLEGIAFGGHWGSAAEKMPGTEFFPTPPSRAGQRTLLFLEALHDMILPNQIAFDRLRAMGYLTNASLICGGQFWEKDPVREWLINYCAARGIPLVYHLRFGHMHPISILPVGTTARLDTRTFTLTW